jgi:hypothetical protein
MADDEIARQARAKELREEIERLRSGEGSEEPPKSPRDFVERAASEEAEPDGDETRHASPNEDS